MSVKNRAAIYARFSSHNQRDESIEIQVEKSREYCKTNALEVVRVYTDAAKTGRTTDRDGFRQMMADAAQGIFDYVVIYKVTRIMRNRDEMAVARIELRKHGVEILYAGETLGNGSTRVLHLGMLEVLAEYESAINSERVRDGIAKNATRGMANGQVRYGWRIVNGYYEIDDHEAAVLRRMKNMLLSGSSVAEIARAFPSERTHRGSKFSFNFVTRLLRREQNCGVYDYAGVRIEGGMPALWSREEQDMVESMLTSRHRPHRKSIAAEDCPLSGKMWCAECGQYYIGHSGTSKSGKVYTYYKCMGCRRAFRREIVEDAVCDAVVEAIGDADTRARIAQTMAMYDEECPDEGVEAQEAECRRIRSEINRINTAFERVWKAIEDGIDIPGGPERIASLKQHKSELEKELARAESESFDPIQWEDIDAWLDDVAAHPDPLEVINGFVRLIEVSGDELHLYFEFDGWDDDLEESLNAKHPPMGRVFAEVSSGGGHGSVCEHLMRLEKSTIRVSRNWFAIVAICESTSKK